LKAYPVIDHYTLVLNGKWSTITFLPIFDGLKWATDMPQSFCAACPFACYCHPLVRDARNPHEFHKLCTVFLARTGLLDMKALFGCKNGCACKDDDYSRAVALLKRLN